MKILLRPIKASIENLEYSNTNPAYMSDVTLGKIKPDIFLIEIKDLYITKLLKNCVCLVSYGDDFTSYTEWVETKSKVRAGSANNELSVRDITVVCPEIYLNMVCIACLSALKWEINTNYTAKGKLGIGEFFLKSAEFTVRLFVDESKEIYFMDAVCTNLSEMVEIPDED